MPDNALERALDELYAADPDAFVTLRKQLVADLRAAGDRAAANHLKAARRPSTSAWALNQLARRHPERIETLLARSNELRAAQSHPGPGSIDAMQETIRAHRRALGDATDAALEVLGTRANDTFRNEIVSSLRAASTDPDVGRQLELGRLVREADGASGFPDATHLTLVPDPPPAKPATPKTGTGKTGIGKSGAVNPAREQPEAPADGARAREESSRAAREAEHEAARAAQRQADLAARDDALAQAAAAGAEAEHAETRVEQLTAELDAARRDARDARARSRQATAEAARLAAKLR